LYETIKAAHLHEGASFVRIFQRCPHYTASVDAEAQKDPGHVLLMKHEKGIPLNEGILKVFRNQTEHDLEDLCEARKLAEIDEFLVTGLFYCNSAAQRYDRVTANGLGMPAQEKVAAIGRELDRFKV
jgi:hypothetical protein